MSKEDIEQFLSHLKKDDLAAAKETLRDVIVNKAQDRLNNISKEIDNNE